MKTHIALLWLMLVLTTVSATSQTRVEAKQGKNILILDIYNRTSESIPNLQVRFANGQPTWFTSNTQPTGSLSAYLGENKLRSGRTQLQIPFDVGFGYDTVPIKVELLSNNILLGTFDVVLSFADKPGSTISSKVGESASNVAVAGESSTKIPEAFALRQNYPNPFNPTTIIQFDLPAASHVSLKLFNLLGQEVRTLFNGEKNAGYHQVIWDGKNEQGITVPTGIYIYRIATGSIVQTRKMMLVR